MIREVVSSKSPVSRALVLVFGWAAVVFAIPGPVLAQDETPTPTPRSRQVRSAIPVASPAPDPPVARAVPFDTPAARPKAVAPAYPVPGSDAAADPVPTPALGSPEYAQQRRARATPTPDDGSSMASGSDSSGDDSSDIRIAPQAPGGPAAPPDVIQFNLANDFYVRKQYTQAAAEYERYLGEFPDGAQRQAALWWLGECYRFLNRTPAARSSYQNLVIAFKEGEYVGPATYRLATIDFNAQNYRSAAPLFQRSVTLAKADDVRLSSLYFEALSLEKLDRRDETAPVYEDIVSISGNNPYRDDARLALAHLAILDKHPADAFKQYEALSREATKPALQAECSLKAGLLARELNQNETAAALFTRATTLPSASAAVRADAMIAQLHLLYDTNKYRQLLDAYVDTRPALSDALQPEAMLLAANAQRQLGQHAKAQQVYDEIITQYPKSAQAPEARYQRIISLYASNDPNFVKEADEFVAQGNDQAENDQVRLMKADTLFKQGNFMAAAYAYNVLDGSPNLPAKYRAETAYRLGYCYAQAGDADRTIDAFTRFIHSYPDHPFTVKALIQRAVAYQKEKKYQNAMTDYTTVIAEHPDAKEREAALEQKALILGQQGDDHGMIDTFRTLLKDYPKSESAGRAHFAIGQAQFTAADYAGALDSFAAARRANSKEYAANAGLMIILCDYQLKNAGNLATEIKTYEDAKSQPPVPSEILRWLGEREYDAKDFAGAEGHLATATESPGNRLPDTWLLLARTRLELEKWDAALAATAKYLEAPGSAEPAAHAQGLLVRGEALIGLQRYDEAQKASDDALDLQPEGTLNAKARILAGRVAYARGKYADAAKLFMSVSVLYDDPQITPQALSLAADAFEKAGRSDGAAKASEELKSRFPDYTAPKVAQ
jgi:TolA-binding protein